MTVTEAEWRAIRKNTLINDITTGVVCRVQEICELNNVDPRTDTTEANQIFTSVLHIIEAEWRERYDI